MPESHKGFTPRLTTTRRPEPRQERPVSAKRWASVWTSGLCGAAVLLFAWACSADRSGSSPTPAPTQPTPASPAPGNATAAAAQAAASPPAASSPSAPAEVRPAAAKTPPPQAPSDAGTPSTPPSGLQGHAAFPGFTGKRVAIVQTSNVGGDIDPCGCKVNPQGGLARKARWLSQHGKGWDGILLVDAGDLFAERGNLDPAELPMVWDRALLYLDVFAQLGHDAQGLGDRDFALGVPKLKELEAKAKFPFVCANVVDASTGQPVFKPRVVVEKAGLKIGIFGLAPQATLTRLDLEKANNIRFESPFDAARAQVAALNAEGVSAIVALAHLNLDELEQLAREVPGITLVAGSNSARELPVPVRVKDTWITDGHAQGKFLSVLSLLVGEGETKPSFADPNRRSMLEQKRSALQRRVEAREVAIKKATEEAGGKEDNNLEWLQQNLAKLRAELQELDLEIEETSAPGAVSKSFAVYDYVSMDAAVGDDPNVQALTEALKSKYPILAERAEAKLEEAAVPDPKAPPGPPTTPAAGP